MMFLGLCHNLKYLDLSNNAITRKPNYRERVKSNVPNLVFLDHMPYGEVSDQLISEILASEYKPNESEVPRNVMRMNAYNQNLNIENLPRQITINVAQNTYRPGTASSDSTGVGPRTNDNGSRPSTSDGTRFRHDVTIGEPVCGSIVRKARKMRKQRTAWGESTSCSSLSSSDSSCNNFKFLKEEDIVSDSPNENEESSESLLEESRQWRERNQENMKKYSQ